MVPMHAEQGKRAFHEPAVGMRTAMSTRIKSEALADKAVRAPVRRWFMVPMRDSEIVEASHEPGGASGEFCPLEAKAHFPHPQVSKSSRTVNARPMTLR